MTEDLHTRLIFITCVIAVAAATDGIGLYTGTLGGNGGRGKWGGNGEMGGGNGGRPDLRDFPPIFLEAQHK